LLDLLFWQWRPLQGTVWQVNGAAGREVFWAVFVLGWVILLTGTFMIDHFDLFGLKQVWLQFRNRPYKHPPFKTTGYYRYVRNPLMLGFIISFWAAPTMSTARLLFAVAATGYILVGIWFEERDHAYYLGEAYRRYKARTPMLLPLVGLRGAAADRAGADGRGVSEA
jgi:protein-S-isoprenylcysteine O-methyltransferase Ste14